MFVGMHARLNMDNVTTILLYGVVVSLRVGIERGRLVCCRVSMRLYFVTYDDTLGQDGRF